MNKDEIEVGDLVTFGDEDGGYLGFNSSQYIGLVLEKPSGYRQEYSTYYGQTPGDALQVAQKGRTVKIHWLKPGYATTEWETSIIKLSPTQEEQNE